MAPILILKLIVLLAFITAVYGSATPTVDCPKLENITIKSPIVTEKNALGMTANVTATSSGTVISLRCNDFVNLVLNSTGIIRCVGGNWEPPQPHCVPKPPIPPPPVPNNPHLDTIVGGVISGCLFVLFLVSIPEMVKRGRALRWRKLQEAARLIEEDNNKKRFYKIWTCGRNTKQFIKANGLTAVKREASRTLKKPIVRIVLEEDGTEVNSDDILDACADLRLMVLAEGELWWDRNSNSDDGRLDEKRLTFDVCNQDRTKRKLILATSLRDLYTQGQLVFGYLPSRACLESDGTVIDQNVLFAFADSTIMLLEQGGNWSPPSGSSHQSSVHTLPSLDRTSVRKSVTDGMMFKVWSSDHSHKLVVFAKNLADLHIKAAKSHGVPNPIEISELSTGDVIISDTHLTSLANEVLVIETPKYASDNKYEYIEHGTENESVRPTAQTEGQSDNYSKVQKKSHAKEQQRNSTQFSEGYVSNGLPPRENGHVSNGVLNNMNEGNHYEPLPSRPTSWAMFNSDNPSQGDISSSFMDMSERSPRSTPQNNFGYLRDMSNESHGKSSVHEMSQLKSNPLYTTEHQIDFRPMVITGGAKQMGYSDVLF